MNISIITPTYNSGKYIEQMIESIHSQKYPKLEHYVFDSQSKDDTIRILTKYNDQIFWESKKDSGQSDAINKGFKKVSGDIIAWQNADDLYEMDTFEFIADFFTRNPNVGMIYGSYHEIDEQGKRICTVKTKPWNKQRFKRGRFCPVQPTVFWRKEVLNRVGLLNEELNYCMDVDFYSRVIKAGFVIEGVDKVLGSFRVHNESKTQNKENRIDHKNEYLKVLSANFKFRKIDAIYFEYYYQRSQIAARIKRIFDL